MRFDFHVCGTDIHTFVTTVGDMIYCGTGFNYYLTLISSLGLDQACYRLL